MNHIFAEQLYIQFQNDYVYTTKNVWYKHVNRKWVIDIDGHSLKSKINKYLLPLYRQKELNNINRQYVQALSSHYFQHRIMEDCKKLFLFKEFYDKLENSNLIHFTNGVFKNGFDSSRCKYIFTTLSTNYAYGYDKEKVQEIDNILNTTFPDPEIKQYFMEYCANVVSGINIKKLVVHYGEGNNGKTVINDLLQAALGDYMENRYEYFLSNETLVRKGIKLVNVVDVKDSFFPSDELLEQNFQTSIMCNNITQLQKSRSNKIKVIPYETVFTNKINFDVNELKQSFMWMIIQTIKKIKKEGYMKEPEKVKCQIYNNYYSKSRVSRLIKDIEFKLKTSDTIVDSLVEDSISNSIDELNNISNEKLSEVVESYDTYRCEIQ